MTNLVTLEIDGTIALITINRPDAANALSAGVRSELQSIVEDLASNRTVRVVVLTGAGQKAFAAGSDIQDMATMTATQSIELSESIFRLNDALAALPQPVICAVNGWCLGGGLELALACDIRIASETAKFGFPEAKLGIMTGGGGLPRLVRVVGSAIARHMVLTSETLDAERAYSVGLVTKVCPPNELIPAAKALGARIAALAPIALMQIKRTMAIVENVDLAAGMDAEAQACAVCFSTRDKIEGMSAFLEKRAPEFRSS